jgi:hypothetical protein
VFTLRKEAPEEISAPLNNAIFWPQSAYFRVAQALHEKLWQTPLENYIYLMDFSLGCSDIDKDLFTEALFKSNKSVQVGDQENRIEYLIRIKPSENLVYTATAEFGPSIGAAETINLEDYEISAKEALQIAEESGGAEVRLENDNACLIDVFASGSGKNGWYVTYYNINNTTQIFYEVVIDPQTGRIQKIRD